MITVYFGRNGSKIRVEVPENTTLMEAAKLHSKVDIPEIPATCGGSCACCTCHVHIGDQWLDKLGKLDYTNPEGHLIEYEENFVEGKSRLSCQINLKPEHDGLIVHLLNNELL